MIFSEKLPETNISERQARGENWFAWRPVRTYDLTTHNRGWAWLRRVRRERVYGVEGCGTGARWGSKVYCFPDC